MENTVVLHARDTKKALPIVASGNYSWLYLGQNIIQRESIARVMGTGNRYFIGDLLQQVAHEQKEPYLNFIAELGTLQKNKLYWWASNIAYRNPYLPGNLFLLWCYSAVFEKICSTKKDEKGLFLFFIEDCWLYRHLYENYLRNESGIRFMSRKSVMPEMFKAMLRGIAGRVYLLLKAIYNKLWRSRGITQSYRRTGSKKDTRRVYIYSWVQDRFFQENGSFHDAYFGRLPEILTSNGFGITYITTPFIAPSLKRKCLDYSKYEFAFLDNYIKLIDILKCLFIIFPISYNARQRWLRTLLWRQVAQEISVVSGHLLYYFAFKRLLKEIREKEITIIYPFENQPWDKMLCLASKEFSNDIKLIAYQHALLSSLLLNYFLGTDECNIMPLPHVVITAGENSLEQLTHAGYGNVELINGGALRYEYLHGKGTALTKHGEKLRKVLLTLPYNTNLALEMVLASLNAFKDLEEEKLEIIIKAHPAGPSKRLIKSQSIPWPANFQSTDRPTPEMLGEVDLLIYSSTTTGLEAYLAGVPVVKYCSEHIIDIDPLDIGNGSLAKSCYENNMKHVVLSALDETGNIQAEHLSRDLNKFFSRVNEDVWKQVVKH